MVSGTDEIASEPLSSFVENNRQELTPLNPN